MCYSNPFLRNFRPVYAAILQAKRLRPERVETEVVDEEPEGRGIFEPTEVSEVLRQLSPDLNFLSIYTDRPAYFSGFAETMYEENGLVVQLFPKLRLRQQNRSMNPGGGNGRVILDFEWEGKCYDNLIQAGICYIPIHKKPWETAENLDIAVPIGYNTVIVKSICDMTKKPRRDRLEEAFYND